MKIDLLNRKAIIGALAAFALLGEPARAAAPQGYLQNIKRHVILTSMVSDDGDSNPYAVIVAPVSAGRG